MGFFAAKPKEDVIDKLKKEKDWYLDKIIRIDSVMSNDTNISDKQLYLMDKQSTAMAVSYTHLTLPTNCT